MSKTCQKTIAFWVKSSICDLYKHFDEEVSTNCLKCIRIATEIFPSGLSFWKKI